jgi:hypothetical protein
MAPRIYTIVPPSNPILQVLYFLVGGILLIGAVIAGAFILTFALGIALVVGLVLYVRIWWLRRKMMRAARASGSRESRTDSSVLEVEYTVVSERDEHDD